MFQKQGYIDKINKNDMEQGLRDLRIGDLIFDPWYGFGLIIGLEAVNLFQSEIKFYDKQEQKFLLDMEQAYFLKRNIPILVKVSEMNPRDNDTRKIWSEEMYCIF